MAWEADTVYEQWREVNFGGWPAQLHAAGATMLVVQFGQMESLDGPGRLTEFTAAYHRLLDEFAQRTRRVVLLSPMPFEKPGASHAPNLPSRNADAKAYAEAVREIAAQRGAVFVDLFSPFVDNSVSRLAKRRTRNGIHLTGQGLDLVGTEVSRQLGIKLPVACLRVCVRRSSAKTSCGLTVGGRQTGRSSMVTASANDTAGLVEACRH